jgi:uncharacterized membrane protein YeaQ/YmgE (transglycosylase-associated protein family)
MKGDETRRKNLPAVWYIGCKNLCGGHKSPDVRKWTEVHSMAFIGMLVIGLVVGAVAKLLMPGRDPGGIIVTMLLGIAGSILAGFLGRALGWYEPGQAAGFIGSVVGAIILLAIYRLIIGGTAGRGGLRRAA